MSSPGRFRRLPPVCLLVAGVLAILGRLRFERGLVGREVAMEDGRRFRVFRQLCRRSGNGSAPAVFVVRFRFKRFSHRVNRRLSLIPVPLIGGFPGFRQKLWMVDDETGVWQGVYEWESAAAVELYRRSFVLGMMNRRAEPGSLTTTVLPQARLADYLEQRLV